jgi:hypothetical protein
VAPGSGYRGDKHEPATAFVEEIGQSGNGWPDVAVPDFDSQNER